jgi:ankyrin repeat protein
VELLASGSDVNAKNNEGETALHCAARNGHEDVVELLRQHGGNESLKPNVPGYDRLISMDAFRKALMERDFKRAKAQIKYNPDLVLSKDMFSGSTPLHFAALSDTRDLAELLLASQADVNAKDQRRETPLHHAAKTGNTDVVELLLVNQADINAKAKYGETPLHFAAEQGRTGVAKLLLARKADVNAANNINATPLHLAALNGHNDVAKLLLACGADVNVQESKYGRTPLQLAVESGYTDVAELLRGHHEMLSRSLRVEDQEPIAQSRLSGGPSNAEIPRFAPKTAELLIWISVPVLLAVLVALSWLISRLF